ncbi:hypothetical protein [Arthrobacter globiformis]|uniref:hypothetical protein n=1 Tax=Arthrobacter globiformis TaxID=1665 RepID=UPI00278AF5B4|nr:hypothetical protein [Arthrobacter globiformis]MDQ0867414.1 hypothetical protein [Arthrobacter globiformis]
MTITPEAPAIDTPVDVRFTPTGTPLAVRYAGQIWAVAAEPVHWFTRDSWWENRRTAPVGVGNVVDIEHWRVQVRSSSAAALRTFELRRNPLAEQWLLEAITDN